MNDSDESLLARDRRWVWHPYTQHGLNQEPLAVVGAQGASLELASGQKLIDGISSWWATLHGHGEPRLVRAAHEQMQRLDHVLFAGTTHEPAVALAETLVSIAPPGLERVFYSDNGSTAVEVALKMVLQFFAQHGQAQRRVFVALEGGYHGDTFGSMSVGDPKPFFEPFAGLLFESVRVVPGAEALEQALVQLGPRAAGVIVEPLLQGAAGMRTYPAAFVRAARERCDAHGVMLIADEVMTGFGRTGTTFACEQAGITPDLLCLAKGLTGGMFPLAATLCRESLFEGFRSTDRARTFFHGHTFTAHPVGCAIALESARLGAEQRVPARLAALGKRVHERLAALHEAPHVTNLRQLGGMVAFDLIEPSGADAGYLSKRGPQIGRIAEEHGVLLRPLGNVVYALPPACTTEAEADQIAEAMLACAAHFA
ncbi:MAG: adenosylmethionine--8-amino-7-oxononanoate transaminase [Planctomycetes bacterium]|nr:adenosylmethionine--8-amino-7-oxononanoate transaminase [Planctomycetota bacterium]MCB9909894.1 adenosylmethionine--8-amino-7-oxononanoate transaminase [Planctomycetota bacterium]HPF14320.1 adenosylmethionine--8-amino-7-oxononanoate transaminase [Planctomycetota bacterium]HRV80280.1 adenosylmethionine--8-amino-7-oxononanoate transaminase [Planctomycetota bacterium]